MECVRKFASTRVAAVAVQIVLLLFLTALSAGAQKNRQRAQEQQEFLNQQLLNQTFETKILIGNCGSKLFLSQLAKVLVDTEIHSDLTISYLHRGPMIGTLGGAGAKCQEGQYQAGAVNRMLEGTAVTVRRIDMKDNRFELALQGPNDTYGRLKFFYGGAYASDSAPLVLLIYVSKVLRLKAFEKIDQARQQYRNLAWELASTYDESRFQVPLQPNDEEAFRRLVQEIASQFSRPQPDGGRPASEEVQRLHAAEAILQKILGNRDEYLAAVQQLQAASLFEPADREIWHRVGEGVRARLVEFEARAKEERKLELRGLLTEKRKEYEREKDRLPKSAPRGLDQLKSAIDGDDKCLALLDQRRSLVNELAQLGEPQTSSEVAEIEKEQTQLQQVRQQWEGIRRPLELSKLNDDYVELTLRRHELDRRSAADPSIQSALRALLEQLRANRERAVQLGETRATKQLDEIRRRLATLQ